MKRTPRYIDASDEELIGLVQRNDAEAFRELFGRYKRRIMAYCLRMMRNREAAEDVFQSVFTNCFEKRDQFSGPSFSAWIFGIARNSCLKSLMKIRQEQKNFSQLEIEDIVDVPQHEENSFHFENLLRSIEQLTEDFREPIQLRYFDQLSYEQIAQVLAISLPLVKVRIHRAKKLLKEILIQSDQESHESR